ncbi:MAG: 50S ribosomal protein L10 [Christensenellaceae bacterium]|nr:50S ribosomal protein L10 [Christensenellaceae bacterium]
MKESTLKAKEAVVSEIKEKFENAQSIMFLDYRGLTVEEVTDLRNKMRAAGVEYKVLKNTMIKRAADSLGIDGLDSVLEGPTAVAIGTDDPVAPAKILSDFVKAAKKTEIKGGIVFGKAATKEEIQYLATLPSKEQLIASLMSVINGVTSKFVRTLEAIRVQKEEGAAE